MTAAGHSHVWRAAGAGWPVGRRCWAGPAEHSVGQGLTRRLPDVFGLFIDANPRYTNVVDHLSFDNA